MHRVFRILAAVGLLATLPTSTAWAASPNHVEALFARATPSMLPALGGTVIVTGHTRYATTCSLRVLSKQPVKVTLPVPKPCIKGNYSARLTLGPNSETVWRPIRMALVAKGNGTASVAFYVNLNPKQLFGPPPATTLPGEPPPTTGTTIFRPPQPYIDVEWLSGSIGKTTWTGDPPIPLVVSQSGPDAILTLSAEGINEGTPGPESPDGKVASGYLSLIGNIDTQGALPVPDLLNQNPHGLAELTYSVDFAKLAAAYDIATFTQPISLTVVYSANPYDGSIPDGEFTADAHIQITKASTTTTTPVLATTTTVTLSATLEPSTCQGSPEVCTYAVTATMDTTDQNGNNVTAFGNYAVGLYTDGSLANHGGIGGSSPTLTYQFGAVMNESVTLYVSAVWTYGGSAGDFGYAPSTGTSNTLTLPD